MVTTSRALSVIFNADNTKNGTKNVFFRFILTFLHPSISVVLLAKLSYLLSLLMIFLNFSSQQVLRAIRPLGKFLLRTVAILNMGLLFSKSITNSSSIITNCTSCMSTAQTFFNVSQFLICSFLSSDELIDNMISDLFFLSFSVHKVV